MIFIKHYDPRSSKLTLISRLLLHPSTMLSRLAERLADKLHLPRDRTKVCRQQKLQVLWLQFCSACECQLNPLADAVTAWRHESRENPVCRLTAAAGGGEGSAGRLAGRPAAQGAAVQDAAPARRHHRRARGAVPGAHAASPSAALLSDVWVDVTACTFVLKMG